MEPECRITPGQVLRPRRWSVAAGPVVSKAVIDEGLADASYAPELVVFGGATHAATAVSSAWPMTFRDDQEALLARASALDREVKRLEDENAELRGEREAAEAERAVETRKREELAALAAKAPRSPPPLAKRSSTRAPRRTVVDKERRHRLELAFTSPVTMVVLVVTVIAALVGGYFAGAQVLKALGLPFPPLLLVFMLAFTLVAIGLYVLALRFDVHRATAWLAALELPLDHDHYLDYMATRFEEQLKLEIAVPNASEDDRRLIRDAVVGGAHGTTARWDGDTLHVTSRKLKVHFTAKMKTYSHNQKVHRWFRRFAHRVLLPIAKLHPIERIRIVR